MYVPVLLSKHVLCNLPENNSNPMIAYMMMTNRTRRAICSKGTIARRIEFKTTCRPAIREIRVYEGCFNFDNFLSEALFLKNSYSVLRTQVARASRLEKLVML